MTTDDFNKIIQYIIERCADLKNKYVNEDIKADYICILSQSQDEYNKLLKHASSLGKVIDNTSTGPVFKFNSFPSTILGKPKVLKIRIPDSATRPERGDVDFITNYGEFKSKYLDEKRFKLIRREKFEMIELRDEKFDVLVYFSSIPPSKILGIN